MYLGDGLGGSCKIQRWLESYSGEAGRIKAPGAGPCSENDSSRMTSD